MKVGDKINVWWRTDTPNNMATVLAVLPYTGNYPQWFNCVLRLTCPNTVKGYTEMAHMSDTPPVFTKQPKGSK